MASNFNLPEKNYFTRSELAKRWQCDIDLVDYYVDHHMLREAFCIHTVPSLDIFLRFYLECDGKSEEFNKYRCHIHDLKQFPYVSDIFEVTEKNVTGPLVFGYADALAFVASDKPKREQEENVSSQGKVTRLAYLSGFHSERYIPIKRAEKAGRNEPPAWQFDSFYVDRGMRDSLVIPREERDRFESAMSKDGVKASLEDSNLSSLQISNTMETGYLVTIGLLARFLAETDDRYQTSPNIVSAKAIAESLDNMVNGLSGHGVETLRKRIAKGLTKLKDVS